MNINKYLFTNSDPFNTNPPNNNKYFDIPKKDLINLIDLYGRNKVVDEIESVIVDLPFPFKYLWYDIGKKDECYSNLLNWKPTTSRKHISKIDGVSRKTKFNLNFRFNNNNREYLTLIVFDNEYENIDILTDLFQENARLECTVKDNPTPIEFYFNNIRSIINISIDIVLGMKESVVKIDSFGNGALRESMYILNVKECTSYKCTMSRFITKFFRAKKVLDPCAGYGDRILGVMSCNDDNNSVSYIGFDPNTTLKIGHNNIIHFLRNKQGDDINCNINYVGFEHSSEYLKDESFDLIFTSPPFFTFEHYDGDKDTQSISTYSNGFSWIYEFLIKTIIGMSWSKLDINGHCVIYITDVSGTKGCCELMILMSQILYHDCYYEGMISFKSEHSNRHRPHWVFKKLENKHSQKYINELLSNVKKYYPDFYKYYEQLI